MISTHDWAYRTMLIKAAINGSRFKSEHPAIPVSPSEVAEAAAESVSAGAGAIHFHVRSADGHETLDANSLELSLNAIRTKLPNIPLGVSTGAWIIPDPLLRLEAVRQWNVFPDFASVNFHEEGAGALARLLLESGIGVESGLCSSEAADVFVHSGVAPQVLRILIEPKEQELNAALETVSKIKEVLSRARLDSSIVLHGTENTVWELLDEALRNGYDIRIGFEDTLKLPDGETAPNNSALIREAQRRIGILQPRST